MPSKKQDAPQGASSAARPEGTGASRIADALHAEPCAPRRAAWYAGLLDGLSEPVLAAPQEDRPRATSEEAPAS